MSGPVLLEVTRGGLVESRHRGSLVLLDACGGVTVRAGDVNSAIYPRSALKPLQTVALVAAGFGGPAEAVALASASHDGEDVHLIGVRAVLDAAGLGPAALQCPPDLPTGRAAMVAYVAAGGTPAPICHNCSGKHAAMLATCVHRGWDIAGYRDPQHPLQRAIQTRIEQLCGVPIAVTSVDGCGAPAHALSLVALARGFAALAVSDEETERAVRESIRAHPRLFGGTGRAVTQLNAAVDGLVCKDGAEGVWAAALPDGRAAAVKVADGSARAMPPLLAAILRHWGNDGDVVRRWSSMPVLGGDATVGAVTWSAELRDVLGL